MSSHHLIKAIFTASLVAIMVVSCDEHDNGDDHGSLEVTAIKFIDGLNHPGEDKPVETATGGEPVITELSYSKVVRQGGNFSGYLSFTDDDYTGVTTLLIKIDQDDGFTEFAVTPVLDPLSTLTRIGFNIEMARNFTPGVFTFYIGLKDTDGNVSAYLHRILIVKSLQDLSITSMTPFDGSIEEALNLSIRATFSQQVFSDETKITLMEGETPILGTSYMSGNGRAMTFIPDIFLSPNAVHRANITLTVNNKQLSHTFTTEDPAPLPTPNDLVGKTFGVSIGKDNLIEPEEGKALFDTIPVLPTILFKVLDYSGTSLQTLSAIGEEDGMGGHEQSPLVPTDGPSASDFVNPYFKSGPSSMGLDLGSFGLAGVLSIEDIYLTGKFVTQGNTITAIENGSFSGNLDSEEANAVISVIAQGDIDVCEILPMCDRDGLILLRAEKVDGQWQQGIAALYEMNCVADANTIVAALGGDITVTCTTLEDALPYQGGDITLLAQKGTMTSTDIGTWNTGAYVCSGTPPTCQVPDASGVITAIVTVSSGELTTGETSFRVGGSCSSPIGTMHRVQSVALE
jgi:hypothetical protein